MAFLQNSTLLQSTGHGAESKSIDTPPGALQTLRSRASIAALVGLVRNPVGTVGEAVEGWRDGLTAEERGERRRVEEKKHIHYLRMRNAEKYDDWKCAAAELDELSGSNEWKKILESPDYDFKLIQARLKQLDDARLSQDPARMLFLIRTALTRNLGGMGNLKLYKYTHVGTKDLIEQYITSALDTLQTLLDVSAKSPSGELQARQILEQVLSARQAFGRSALLLSGGATFGMNHIGVIKTLWENKLLPRIISGASAGSIVCAVLCTRTDEEVPDLIANFCHGDLAVFEEEGNEDTVLGKISRFLKHGALFDISHLIRVMKDMLGDMTFQEAYNRTRRILNICVSSASLYELPRLLNYVTAPNVLIWSAVAASCSVPFIFSPATILAKDPKTGETVPWNPSPQTWIDGSVDNDLPMTRLAEMFNVNHFIVSQVNPHVVPFLVKEEDSITQEVQQSTPSVAAGPSWLNSITNLAKSEAIHRMHFMVEMGIFPNTLTKTISVLSQKYSGDITIMPAISYADFPRMLSNPTVPFMVNAMICGERATWPKLSRVRNHCAIELALDDAVQKLRTRVVFSSSQADLRLGAYSKTMRYQDVMKINNKDRKGRRKLSQNSMLDASVIKDLKEGRDRRARIPGHHKTHSMNIPPLGQGEPQIAFSKRAPTGLSDMSNPLHDILSSGAETSNIFTSDSDEEGISSSTASPYSPESPILPELWPTSRHLFPYASQPNTPAIDHSRSSFLFPGNHTSTSSRPESPNLAMKPSLSMTQVKPDSKPGQPSAPEAKYKRLFHSARSRTRSSVPLAVPDTSPQPNSGVKRFNALGLEIDISGTRGMVMRKKRID